MLRIERNRASYDGALPVMAIGRRLTSGREQETVCKLHL